MATLPQAWIPRAHPVNPAGQSLPQSAAWDTQPTTNTWVTLRKVLNHSEPVSLSVNGRYWYTYGVISISKPDHAHNLLTQSWHITLNRQQQGGGRGSRDSSHEGSCLPDPFSSFRLGVWHGDNTATQTFGGLLVRHGFNSGIFVCTPSRNDYKCNKGKNTQ